jgi:hypothetical protein
MAKRNGKLVLIDEDTWRLIVTSDEQKVYEKMIEEHSFGYVVHFLIHKALKAPRPLTPKERMGLGGKFKGAPLLAKKEERESEFNRLRLSEVQREVFKALDKHFEKTKVEEEERARELAALKARSRKV